MLEFYEWLCEMTQKLPFSFVLIGRPAVWRLVVYYGLLAAVLWCFLSDVSLKMLHLRVLALKKSFLNIVSDISALKMIFSQVLNLKKVTFNIVALKTYVLKGLEKYSYKKKTAVKQEIILAVGLLCAAIILVLPVSQNPKLMFLDVSQGDGVIITTAEGTVILSDCGSSDVKNLAEYRLSPVLKQQGILLIDMAVVSHLDNDHISGIRELLQFMPIYEGEAACAADYSGAVGIKELVLPQVAEKSDVYQSLEQLAMRKNVAVRYVQAGDILYREKAFLIECIYPLNAKESDNDTSLVFLLQTPELFAWLTGDAGISSETEIMKRLAEVNMSALQDGKTVLLKVGHHGSKTSSGEAFIEFVKPQIAVISCGYQNSYGHPHAEVLEYLAASGTEVFRTDLQGAILVSPDNRQGVSVRGWRKQARE